MRLLAFLNGARLRVEIKCAFVFFCTACKLHVAFHGCMQGRYEVLS